jgi:hypothetical protein
MAGCDITRNINSLGCKNNVAGLKAVYVANYDEYDFDTSAVDEATGQVLSALPAELTEVLKYPLKNTGNTFGEEIVSSRDNGTTVFNQTLNFVLTKIDAVKQFQIKNLAWGRPLIFVETNGGDIFLMGMENGNEVTGNTTVEGTMEGVNTYQLVATAQERETIYFLDDAAIIELKALVATNPA